MDEFVKDFLVETAEALAALDNDLVRLEANPGEHSLLTRIFRTLHTIKGTSGFLGLTRLGQVAHAGESVLDRMRDGRLAATPEVVTAVLRSVDAIKRLVANLEASGSEGTQDDTPLISALEALAGQAADVAAPPAEPRAAPSAAAPAGPAAAAEEPRESALAAQNVRVGIDLLETLMTTVSELVLTRNQLLQLLRSERDSAFAAPLQRLSLITSELQESVMKTRMQPIGNAWAKLPRMVRDLARELDKKIELVMEGADTEVDRQVLELVRDPLTHIVRNCADHGLERPAARLAAGKDETGRIHLQAYHEGGHIIIRIADDGRGLDEARIRAKTLASGIAGEAELAAMSEAQVLRLIFRPGFSTAETVSAVSGRGVGMDVVRSNVLKIGGAIDLESAAGRGTTVIIKIPLTLAIVSALIVGCAGERFAVPQISVVELVGVDGEHRIERINDSAVLRLRDRLLPLVDLRTMLALESGETGAQPQVVVTQVGPHRFGIIVDGIYDTEEIVVKPVATLLKSTGVFSGNTILGDGAVCMILDPNGILARVGAAEGATAAGEGAAPAAAARELAGEDMRLLLVRAGTGMRKAIPLDLVARLEEIAVADIRVSDGRMLVPYRNRLMPLVLATEDVTLPPDGRKPVLVFSETDPGGTRRATQRERQMGLVVDGIEDIVDSRVNVEIRAGRPDIIGSALIDGEPTEVVDTAYHLTRASADWFRQGDSEVNARRVLLVDDSGFFRNLITSLLRAAGIDALTAASGEEALALLADGPRVDLVVTDIEMGGLDGYQLAQRMRGDPRLGHIPIIALSGHAAPRDLARGAEAGFTRHLAKLNRDELIATITDMLAETPAAA